MIRKHILFLLFMNWFISHNTNAQIVSLSDSFSDGNFTGLPAWLGDTAKFKINSNKQLQLDAPGSSSPANLVLSSSVISAANWEFWMKMDFAPSSSNYAKVYLSSTKQDLTKPTDGYFLKIGGISGTADNVSLYRQDGNNSVLLIGGVDGTVGNSPVEVKIKVTVDALGEWELLIDTSTAGNSYVSQGKAIDQPQQKSNYFGLVCHYTSTRSNKFYFDNFSIRGLAFKDTVPPTLQQINILDSVRLQLEFSERMDSSTALDSNHYFVDNTIGKPKQVDFIGNDRTKVELLFLKPFKNATDYFLTVFGVKDQENNPIKKDSLSFFYFVPANAKKGDVVINEFYPDFSESNGLPEAEFVELYNASNKIFDLANWKISDAFNNATIHSAVFRPNAYVILCSQKDSTKFKKFGEVATVNQLPSLNNNGDLIRLEDQNSTNIDELNYDKSWYHNDEKSNGGWSIERINPYTLCSGKLNFESSKDSIGGTPGKINSQFNPAADTIPPKLLSAKVLSSSRILLNFNEPLDSNSVGSAMYIFSGNAKVDTSFFQNSDLATLMVHLSMPLDSGKINTLAIMNVTDCPGNPIGSDNTVELVVPVSALYRDLVINEFYINHKNSNGLPDAPFIEIYNASNKIFQLVDWSIGNGSHQEKLGQYILQSGEYLLLCSKEFQLAYSNYGVTDGLVNIPSFAQRNDEIHLSDNHGNLIDYINYSEEWYKDENKNDGGWTIEQINPYNKCNGPNNFAASKAKIGGSPGEVNSIFSNEKDIEPPQLLKVLVYAPDSLKLIFDEGIDESTVDLNDFVFSNNRTINNIHFTPYVYNSFYLMLSPPLDTGKVETINIHNISDCEGNAINETTQNIAAPEIAKKGDIVINEVLFNPYSGGNDFVEIYNRSNKIIDLQNWKIANGENEIADDIENIVEFPTAFYPGEYFVITEKPAAVERFYPRVASERFITINSLPAYNNDRGEVFLFDVANQLIDHIGYSESMHFELLKELKGVSLERINPNGGSHAADNFHSAAESEGFATAGYQNSQYSLGTIFKGEVNISPETFSPNNDGYQDWLNINYQFPINGYVANISIYDKNGRLIHKLANNVLLGKKGHFKWDGLTVDNNKAPIGMYLIFFEVFHPNGDKEAFKKTAVLAN